MQRIPPDIMAMILPYTIAADAATGIAALTVASKSLRELFLSPAYVTSISRTHMHSHDINYSHNTGITKTVVLRPVVCVCVCVCVCVL
jgi:hypothetical protein